MNYQLIEVTDAATAREFLQLPLRIYQNDQNWVRPLDKDIESVFDPKKNKYFREGECIRWIVTDNQSNTLGRVAAFYNQKIARNNEQPTGGMGFFECVNDKSIAFMLFDACKNWLQQKGMEAMDGPVNFGERDRWWGLLVDGFIPANYVNNYNPPYYQSFFEEYGFKDYFQQYTYQRKIALEGLSEQVVERAKRILSNSEYSVRHISPNAGDKPAEEFCTVYNKAWTRFPGVKPITIAHAKLMFKSMKPIMDPQLVWFAYHNNEPIAFFIMLPEINQIIRHLNGKMNAWGKLKFVYFKWRKECKKAFGMVFGVVPEFQAKGVEAAMVMAFAKVALDKKFPYTMLELNWIGDFNPTMNKLALQIGGKVCKTHITYRLLFNPDKEFVRCKKVS